MANYTLRVVGYPIDYVYTTFPKISAKYAKIQLKITERNPLGSTIAVGQHMYDFYV